jgi:mannose-1-phosphate guanylyltransferase/mannose-6-phosphate isomerase
MTDLIVPLIMCGGAGTRLWPASREGLPKQFLQLFGRFSTFQETLRRVADPSLFGRPIIISNSQYRFLIVEQLADIGMEADILLEPARRDSGPAIAAGAAFAMSRGGDPVIVALAADHVVDEPASFVAACRTAQEAAQAGYLVTFGVRPDRPATEYGYIRPGGAAGRGLFAVDRFVEKPNEEAAARYVADGFLWNSGNFMFRAGVLLEEFRKFEPESAAAVAAAVKGAKTDLGFISLDAPSFEQARAVSVDYAIMENTTRGVVIPVSYGWSDVGSWQAVWDLTPKDSCGNATRGNAVFVEANNSYVSSDKALVALLGVDNLVVIASEDALLVTQRNRVGDMKQVVERLKSMPTAVTEEHLKVHRPWGSYQSLDRGDRHQVKRIVVKPGRRLSLQLHHHRAEHWVVVRGTAIVTVGDEVKTLQENQSTYIPLGTRHRLENPGEIDLELIEVQSGSYLGEDDIVRFDDDYNRS